MYVFNVNLSLHRDVRYAALTDYYSTIISGPALEKVFWFLPCNVCASFNTEERLTT